MFSSPMSSPPSVCRMRYTGENSRTNYRAKRRLLCYDTECISSYDEPRAEKCDNPTDTFYKDYMQNLTACTFCIVNPSDANAAYFSFISSLGFEKIHVKVMSKQDGDPVINDAYVMQILNNNYPNSLHFLKFKGAFVGYMNPGKEGVCLSTFNASCGKVRVPCVATNSIQGRQIQVQQRNSYNSPPSSPGGPAQTPQGPRTLLDVVRANQLDDEKLSNLFKALLTAGRDIGFSHNDLHLMNILEDGSSGQYVLIDYGRAYVNVDDSKIKDPLKKTYNDFGYLKGYNFKPKEHVVASENDDPSKMMYIMNDIVGLYMSLKTVGVNVDNLSSMTLAKRWYEYLEKNHIELLVQANTQESNNPQFYINHNLFSDKSGKLEACKLEFAKMIDPITNFIPSSQGGAKKRSSKKAKAKVTRKVHIDPSSKKKFVIITKQKVYLQDLKGKFRYTSDQKTHIAL